MPSSNRVESDWSDHLVVLHVFKVVPPALCGDTTHIVSLSDGKVYCPRRAGGRIREDSVFVVCVSVGLWQVATNEITLSSPLYKHGTFMRNGEHRSLSPLSSPQSSVLPSAFCPSLSLLSQFMSLCVCSVAEQMLTAG